MEFENAFIAHAQDFRPAHYGCVRPAGGNRFHALPVVERRRRARLAGQGARFAVLADPVSHQKNDGMQAQPAEYRVGVHIVVQIPIVEGNQQRFVRQRLAA